MLSFPKLRNSARWGIALVLGALSAPAAHADGIFVFKNQTYHSDDLAKAFRYESIESHDRFVWVTAEGKRLRFERTKPFTWTELVEVLPARIASPSEVSAILNQLGETERIAKYPAAAPLAQSALTLLREAKASIDKGLVRDGGNWIDRKAFETAEKERLEQEERMIAEMAAARKAREAEKMAAAKQEKSRKEQAENEALRKRVVTGLHKVRDALREAEDEAADLEAENKETIEKLNSILKNHLTR